MQCKSFQATFLTWGVVPSYHPNSIVESNFKLLFIFLIYENGIVAVQGTQIYHGQRSLLLHDFLQELNQHWFSYWLACKALKIKELRWLGFSILRFLCVIISEKNSFMDLLMIEIHLSNLIADCFFVFQHSELYHMLPSYRVPEFMSNQVVRGCVIFSQSPFTRFVSVTLYKEQSYSYFMSNLKSYKFSFTYVNGLIPRNWKKMIWVVNLLFLKRIT